MTSQAIHVEELTPHVGGRHSIAFRDHRCVEHHARWDDDPHRRHRHRVIVEGDKPFDRG